MTVIFFIHGMLFASWTAHIPQIERSLGLSDAGLGLALLGAPVGSVAAILVVAPLLTRVGSRRVIPVTLVGYALAGIAVGLARSPAGLLAALALWGVFQGSLDVAMNTQGIAAQTALGRPIMSGLHASWSLGSFAGAGLGALAVAIGVSLTDQLLVLGPLAGLLALGMPGALLVDRRPPQAEPAARERRVLVHPVVLILGAIALADMLCEGAAADWSAVYLRTATGAAPGIAGLGYAVFSATMVAGRLSGDRLLARRSPRVILPPLAALATAGMIVALVVPNPAVALVGLAALGAGLSMVIPTTFSAAGRLSGVPTATAIATVSGIGWVGFVGGPPLIGRLAGLVSLPVALGLVPLLTAAIALAVRGSAAYDGVAQASDEAIDAISVGGPNV